MLDQVGLFHELGREFPESISGIKAFFQALAPLETLWSELSRKSSFRAPHSLREKFTCFQEVQRPLPVSTRVIKVHAIPPEGVGPGPGF